MALGALESLGVPRTRRAFRALWALRLQGPRPLHEIPWPWGPLAQVLLVRWGDGRERARRLKP
eukprot:2731415-Pyramimonas_sp.AAC.1